MDKKDFLKKFKESKVGKSIDFRNATVSVSEEDQHLVEATIDKNLIKYLKFHAGSGISEVPLKKGKLVLNEKDKGLYTAFYHDEHGQMEHQFHNMTLPILAKNLEVKDLNELPVYSSAQELPEVYRRLLNLKSEEEDDEFEMEEEQEEETPSHVKVKFGDFELELRKSVNSFVRDYKTKKVIKKSLESIRKRHFQGQSLKKSAHKVLEDWDKYKEEMMQTVDAIQRKK